MLVKHTHTAHIYSPTIGVRQTLSDIHFKLARHERKTPDHSTTIGRIVHMNSLILWSQLKQVVLFFQSTNSEIFFHSPHYLFCMYFVIILLHYICHHPFILLLKKRTAQFELIQTQTPKSPTWQITKFPKSSYQNLFSSFWCSIEGVFPFQQDKQIFKNQ